MLRLTRWTIAHRRLVVLAWIALVAGVLAVSQAVGTRTANNFSLPNTGSQRALDLMQSRFPAQAGDSDQIVFRARTGKATDAAVRSGRTSGAGADATHRRSSAARRRDAARGERSTGGERRAIVEPPGGGQPHARLGCRRCGVNGRSVVRAKARGAGFL